MGITTGVIRHGIVTSAVPPTNQGQGNEGTRHDPNAIADELLPLLNKEPTTKERVVYVLLEDSENARARQKTRLRWDTKFLL